MSPISHHFTPSDGSVHVAYYPQTRTSYTTVRHTYYSGGVGVDVPIGFPTDFASIPRLFWILWPQLGPWARAALFHDKIYRDQECSRGHADTIFWDVMEVDKVDIVSRWCLWLAVRCFGWVFWNRQAKLNAKENQ